MIALGAIAACLTACGGGASNDSASEISLTEHVAVAMLNGAPLAACPGGGISVQSGSDTNLDQILQLSEVTSTQFVCHGINGVNGWGGASGLNAQLVISPEPVGPNCLQGGSLVSVGLDTNANSILDLSEVTSVDYLCHGASGLNGAVGANGSDGVDGTNGTNGTNGLDGAVSRNSLVAIVFEPVGKNCSFGGSEVTSGLDTNGDSVLDKDEVTSTAFVCHGAAQTTPAYAYIFNLEEQTVAIDAAVRFDSNGVILGVAHDPGTAEIRIVMAGVYTIAFSLSGAEPSQFGVFVNGQVVLGAVFGSGAGAQQNNGQITVALAAKDVVTVVNFGSAAAVTLPSFTGGKQANVNASISIQKIGE